MTIAGTIREEFSILRNIAKERRRLAQILKRPDKGRARLRTADYLAHLGRKSDEEEGETRDDEVVKQGGHQERLTLCDWRTQRANAKY